MVGKRWLAMLLVFGLAGTTYAAPVAFTTLPYTTTVDTRGLTPLDWTSGETCEFASEEERAVFYRYDAPGYGRMKVDATGDRYLSVFEIAPGEAEPREESLDEQAFETGPHRTCYPFDPITTDVSKDAAYLIRVATTEAGGGVRTLTVTDPGPGAAPHDHFGYAAALSVGTSTFTHSASATTSNGDPVGCDPDGSFFGIGVQDPFLGGPPGDTTWYRYEAAADGVMQARNDAGGESIAIYSGTLRSDLDMVACAYDQGQFLGATAEAAVVAGETYWVVAYSDRAATIDITITPAGPTPLDDFGGAVTIPSLPFSASGDLFGATVEDGEPAGACEDSSTLVHVGDGFLGNPAVLLSHWYTYQATQRQSMEADLDAQFGEQSLAIYKGTGLDDLQLVACQLLFDAPPQVGMQPGESVWLRVATSESDNNNGAATYTLTVDGQAVRNDAPGAAIPVHGPRTLRFDNTDATIEPYRQPTPDDGAGFVLPCEAVNSKSVWYAYTASTDESVVVEVQRSGADLAAATEGALLEGCTTDAVAAPLEFTVLAGETVLVAFGSPHGPTQSTSIGASHAIKFRATPLL